jgi:Ca-activated chloride channel family protein
MLRKILLALGMVGVMLAAASPVLADGVIIVDPPPGPGPEPVPIMDTVLTIRYHRVEVTIEDGVATTRVDQVFLNENYWEAEGTYIFPLPEGAAVSDFVMWVDGEPVRGEILQADEARQIYNDIVAQRRDPALLEYVGRDMLQASIFPIPPGEERRIQLEYTQVLDVEQGLVHYVYPLDTERFSARPLEEVSVHVEVMDRNPIGSIYSPTHEIAIDREGENAFEVGYEESDVYPDRDFELYYTLASQVVDVNLMTYRESASDDGFFLLLITPPIEVDEEEVVEKDVILVLDISQSMHGEKLDQARDALEYVLENLNEEDRFNVIAFSTGTRLFADHLLPAREMDEALDWVGDLEAVGSTDINEALMAALEQVDSDRPTVIIFLTDGMATEGETDAGAILDNVEDEAPDNVRLFAFGVGDDVDTYLLDSLVQAHRGTSTYVREGERIDEAVSAFYASVSVPVLADVELDVGGGIRLEEFYPDPLPDLFAGTQLALAGRYRGDGTVDVTLSGDVNGEPVSYTYDDLRFREYAGGADFIPRLWATRRIGDLLNQIRLHGEEDELVDSVVELSIRYGIITPYTSFLIDENDIFTQSGRDDIAEEFAHTAAEESGVVSGAAAVDRAAAEGEMAGAAAPAELPTGEALEPPGGLGGGGGGAGGWGAAAPEEAVADGVVTVDEVVRLVGDRTFVWRDGVWVDTAYDPDRYTPIQVGFASDDYFDLMAEATALGDYFALGERVIVVYGDRAFEVVEGSAPPIDVEAVLPETGEETGPSGETGPASTGESEESSGHASSGSSSSTCNGALPPLIVAGGSAALPLVRRRRAKKH